MNDTQILTLALSIAIPLSMLIYSNSRVSDLEKNLTKSINEMKETLRAEIKAMNTDLQAQMKVLNAELGSKIDQLSEKVETSMKQHVLEYHK